MANERGFHKEQRFTALNAALNYVISGEMKALTAAAAVQYPEPRCTRTQLEKTIDTLQGTPPVWPAKGATRTYLQGLVTGQILATHAETGKRHGGKTGEKPTTYEIKNTWHQRLAAASGLALEWTLDSEHDSLSLVNLFGKTRGEGLNQAPVTRYKMLDYLLGHPGVSPTNICEAIGPQRYTRNNIGHHVRRLEGLGIFSVTSRLIDYNPDISIDERITYFTPPSSSLDSLIGSALRELYGQQHNPLVIITLAELIQRCHEREPKWELSDIRRHIISNFHTGYPKGWEIMLEPGESQSKTYTVSISRQHRESVRDLIDRIKSLADPETCGNYARAAKIILKNKEAVRYIVEKGLRFSAHGAKRRGEESLRDQLLKTVCAMGPATIRNITAALHHQGLRAADYTVQAYLADMASQGLLEATLGRRDPITKSEVIYYGVPQES